MLTAPWVIAIAFLVYALVSNAWLLFGLPLLLLAYFLSHPAMAFMRRMLRPLMFLLILFVAAMTAYELLIGRHPGMALLGSAILAILAANIALLSLAVKVLIHRATSEEEFLCALWKSNAVRLTTADGSEYSPKPNPKVPAPGRQNKATAGDAPPSQIENNKFAFQGKRHFTKGETGKSLPDLAFTSTLRPFKPRLDPKLF